MLVPVLQLISPVCKTGTSLHRTLNLTYKSDGELLKAAVPQYTGSLNFKSSPDSVNLRPEVAADSTPLVSDSRRHAGMHGRNFKFKFEGSGLGPDRTGPDRAAAAAARGPIRK
jgi:hypothetical protein